MKTWIAFCSAGLSALHAKSKLKIDSQAVGKYPLEQNGKIAVSQSVSLLQLT